jgi:hypothetical protein
MQSARFTDTVALGDTYAVSLQYYNDVAQTQPTNLTGCVHWLTIKRNPTDTDAEALFGPTSFAPAAPLTGLNVCTLTPAQTAALGVGQCYLEVTLEDANGNEYTDVGENASAVLNVVPRLKQAVP